MRGVLATVALLLVASVGGASAGIAVGPPDGVDGGPAGVQSSGTSPAPAQVDAQENETAENNSTAPPLGVSISSFMQSNAQQTDETVSRGMWSAAFNGSQGAAREALATGRVDELRHRLTTLTEERRALLAERRNGTIDAVAFAARMSALEARIRAVKDSVRSTATALNRAQIAPPGLADLQTAARNVTSRPAPGAVPGGNGSWVAGPGNGPPGQAGEQPGRNGTGAGPGNGTGPPGQNGGGPPGANATGQSEGNSPGTPGRTGTGPPDGNETGRPGGSGTGPSGGPQAFFSIAPRDAGDGVGHDGPVEDADVPTDADREPAVRVGR